MATPPVSRSVRKPAREAWAEEGDGRMMRYINALSNVARTGTPIIKGS